MDLTARHCASQRAPPSAPRPGAGSRRGAAGYEAMTNVPARLRERLASQVPPLTLTIERESLSHDGTLKVLFHRRRAPGRGC